MNISETITDYKKLLPEHQNQYLEQLLAFDRIIISRIQRWFAANSFRWDLKYLVKLIHLMCGSRYPARIS